MDIETADNHLGASEVGVQEREAPTIPWVSSYFLEEEHR
jgi:hypothetical protein